MLCTKGVQFSLYGESYFQTDGVAMCSPLGPVLSETFMIELESTLVSTLSNLRMSWKRYVDDINCFIKEDSNEHVMSVLNGFHHRPNHPNQPNQSHLGFACEARGAGPLTIQLCIAPAARMLRFSGRIETIFFTELIHDI